MTPPRDPIAAVTHPDPYPYYESLVASAPLARDASIGMWVASSRSAVRAALTSELCAVRPAAEPIPRALVGSTAGDVFARLVRMSDGEPHRARKRVVASALASFDGHRLAEVGRDEARALLAGVGSSADPGRITAFSFQLPVRAVGRWLGVPSSDLGRVAGWIDDFVGCLAPGSSDERIGRGKRAADALVARFGELCAPAASAARTPLASFAREAAHRGVDADAIVANAIGWMCQAYEATAGLLGNALVALGRDEALRRRVAADPSQIGALVRDVLRDDPPVQNTRRFVVAAGSIAGHAVAPGEAILVVLAASLRDPDPEPAPEHHAFGAGAHACPGSAIAASIAEAGVRELLASRVDPARLIASMRYRPSANTRVPLFGDVAPGEAS